MKNLLIILLLLPLVTHAQLNVTLGAGTDFKNSVANMGLGYETNNMIMEASISPSITRNVNTHNYMGIAAGYHVGPFIPAIGYYYDHVSSDKTDLNKYYVGYSIKAVKEINDNGGVYLSGMYINNQTLLTGGVIIIIK
jgi:hypothetical protein